MPEISPFLGIVIGMFRIEIDLAPALKGPVLEPLRDPAVFSQSQIHPDFHTLVWSNEADFAPEFLHGNVRAIA